jgi:hypothetical protein
VRPGKKKERGPEKYQQLDRRLQQSTRERFAGKVVPVGIALLILIAFTVEELTGCATKTAPR